ncbi:hypothetical protein H4V97_000707 [Flavobacterium sp. CG_23.5]|nr:hypothetical protein [Flavobacterium sp. CG_9.10]MBP2282389.1 hypothetical protein [Flavobacterium sp. CG_23.5]
MANNRTTYHSSITTQFWVDASLTFTAATTTTTP